ncbi:DMT family transporter [Yoonia sediminilitoris]|uniref:Small Multidrug Resistance (SMR) protein n=1 Tax=Yoonia sediminilitoris TaxID=1286148 RepID=A0A2T6KEM9_9RHOB|nr:DMT family transporter [Yoonia sediminilitoris]PUB13579.1 Small Multidrug Resistance (SMR) protein [Yoonia sediminilitoris]RCW94749.1 Small Multidrug Resistance (SMR) protein [Yoonia sediminilitoris]
MGEWLVSIAGTSEGARLATALALMSAIAHAAFGALQKGRYDPWLTRGAIDAWLAVLSAPVALFLVPWPDATTALLLGGAIVIHFAYKVTMALAYERAAYTVVYPVVRGTGPLVTVIAASAFFGEHFTATQWMGVACLSGGILLLALRNLSEEELDLRALKIGLAWALTGGALVAVYTTYDAYGIRQSPDPFTFLAWFFFVTAFDMPILALLRHRRMAVELIIGPLVWRGLAGALIAWVSFGGVMMATRLDKVGEAAVLRETSTVFAALIGWFILGEKVGPRRLILMALVALGAVIVEMGG